MSGVRPWIKVETLTYTRETLLPQLRFRVRGRRLAGALGGHMRRHRTAAADSALPAEPVAVGAALFSATWCMAYGNR